MCVAAAVLCYAVAGAERSWPTNCMALFAQIRDAAAASREKGKERKSDGGVASLLQSSAFYNIFIPFKRASAAHTRLFVMHWGRSRNVFVKYHVYDMCHKGC